MTVFHVQTICQALLTAPLGLTLFRVFKVQIISPVNLAKHPILHLQTVWNWPEHTLVENFCTYDLF